MTDNNELVSQLQALNDPELLDVVRAATAGRPGLGAVHAAAVASTPNVGDPISGFPSVSDVPPPAQVGGIGHTGVPAPDYTARGVPTFDRVREKVEQRFGTAIGSDELARQTPSGQSLEEKWEAREKAGHERLNEIRRSLHGNDGPPVEPTEESE